VGESSSARKKGVTGRSSARVTKIGGTSTGRGREINLPGGWGRREGWGDEIAKTARPP